jgi:hypothetical protein
MHLTDHEVTIATSALSGAIAIAAIIWGYRGVRSANISAVQIARDERVSRHETDLRTEKRIAYVKMLSDFSTLISILAGSSETQWADAVQRAILSLAEVEITAPKNLYRLALQAYAAFTASSDNRVDRAPSNGAFWIAQLRRAMRIDLNGYPVPAPDELNSLKAFPGEED